jgi:hypothetical protein
MFIWRRDHAGKLKPVIHSMSAFDAERRHVIILPGSAVLDSGFGHERMICGSIKYVEKTLARSLTRGNPLDITLYSYHPEGYSALNIANHHRRPAEEIPTEEGQAFYDIHLRKLLLASGENFPRITPEELKKRLSHITVIAYSFGSIVAQDITRCLARELQQQGWSKADIGDTLQELVIISVAGISHNDGSAPKATEFFFTAANDTIAMKLRKYPPAPEALHIRNRRATAQKPYIKRDKQRYVIDTSLPDKVAWQETQCNGDNVHRVLTDAMAQDDYDIPLAHDYRAYLYHPPMGKLLTDVANNAVTRDVGIGDGHQLFFGQAREVSHRQGLGERKGNPADRTGGL